MDIVRLASGKEFEMSSISASPSPPIAYIRVVGSDLMSVAKYFGNPEETVHMVINDILDLDGYSKLNDIIMEQDCIRISLGKA